MNPTGKRYADIVVVGSGAAGMTVSLLLADHYHVTLVSKDQLASGNTPKAQGGIAAAMGPHDNPKQHAEDTWRTGSVLVNKKTARHITSQAPHIIHWLLDKGVPFDRNDTGVIDLALEAGHRHRRIVHCYDATGSAVTSILEQHIRCHPNIEVLEKHMAIDILTTRSNAGMHCTGIDLWYQTRNTILRYHAPMVVLATGGAGQLYASTTNPPEACGDGIAMAYRAGCRLSNMEFVQFHPTCLYQSGGRALLLSEALRGEGARLLDLAGHSFLKQYDERAELAPRDTLSRAIVQHLQATETPHIWLDISHKPEVWLKRRFPTLVARLKSLGYDMVHDPVPITPAAHYMCGGVLTDYQGLTDLPGLACIGESACTGLHGANRLASNSLLECFTMAFDLAAIIPKRMASFKRYHQESDDPSHHRQQLSGKETLKQHQALQECMTKNFGVIRNDADMRSGLDMMAVIGNSVHKSHGLPGADDIRSTLEWENLNLVAHAVAQSAMARRKNIGAHFNEDLKTHDSTIHTPSILSR